VHAFDSETRDGGVKLQYDGVTGTTHQNNWRCQWLWSRDGRFVFVPRHRLLNVDFRSACQQQFPGTTLHYNAQAATGWPWECLGVAGKYYPPPGLNLLKLVRANGYNAQALRARTAGELGVRIVSGSSASASSARAARHTPTTFARGVRTVKRAGSYTVRVRLTHAGRARLRHAKHLRVTFIVRFRPQDGQVQETTTTTDIKRR
jgi:hypothetical protein